MTKTISRLAAVEKCINIWNDIICDYTLEGICLNLFYGKMHDEIKHLYSVNRQ